MSTPTDSVAPTTPTGTSNPWPLWQWLKRIADWIAALSPSGSSEYDTGWVAITPASGFASAGAQVRRIGSVVYLRGAISGSVSTGQQNTIGTVPANFSPAGGTDNALGFVHTASLSNNFFWATVGTSGAINVIPTVSGSATMRLKGLSGYLVD